MGDTHNSTNFYRSFRRKMDAASFKSKLIVSFIFITVPLLIIICAISFFGLRKSYLNSIQQEQQRELEQFNTKLQYIITDVENMSRELVFNNDIQDILTDAYTGEVYPDSTNTAYCINNYISNRDYIDSVVLLGSRRTLYSTDKATTDNSAFFNICGKWWYLDMMHQDDSHQWYPYSTLTTNQYQSVLLEKKHSYDNTLMLIRPIHSTIDYTTQLGHLIIYLDNNYLQNIWENISWGETTNAYIMDENQDFIFYNTESADYSEIIADTFPYNSSTITAYEHQDYVVSGLSMDFHDWNLYMVTPIHEVDSSLTVLKIELLLIACAIVLIVLFLSIFSANTMAKPITALSDILDSYHGAENEAASQFLPIYKTRSDEIGKIYRSYERLENRIDMLIQEIYVKNLEKKDAELALLQSQINPHFLYNTLDSINWLALENDQEEISEMIQALSNTFRLSLMKNNSSFVELEQEILYIQSYLMLQKFRYGNRLDYQFDLPTPLPKLYILRFVLQPIVENALEHGINTLEGGGFIHIKLYTDDALRISITNDGAAISLEDMEAYLYFDPKESDILAFKPDGYGVQNIYRRIKIMCGDKYGIRYEKNQTQTICHITLPLKSTL